MTEPHRPRVKYVIGPDGSPITLAELPRPGFKRWTTMRKAEVVFAVQGGVLSLQDACTRYSITIEDFLVWQDSVRQQGFKSKAPPIELKRQ